VPASAQQPVPDRYREEDDENADYENWRKPGLRLRIAADTDHKMRDLIGAARFRAPKAVAVGREDEFALGIGASGYRRGPTILGGEHSNLGIRQRFAILSCELDCHLAGPEKIKSRRGEKP
jgi:hypothetical protein